MSERVERIFGKVVVPVAEDRTAAKFKKVGLDWKRLKADPLGDGYDYLVNEYIPDQGMDDMLAFIDLGFQPVSYLLWKLERNGLLCPVFATAVKDRLCQVFGIWTEVEESSI